LFIIYRGVLKRFARRVGATRIHNAGFALARDNNATGDSNFASFLAFHSNVWSHLLVGPRIGVRISGPRSAEDDRCRSMANPTIAPLLVQQERDRYYCDSRPYDYDALAERRQK